MTVVIQASMGEKYSPTKDATEANTQQLKSRIKELEGEIDELNHKYNEELRIERVRRSALLNISLLIVVQS